MRINDCPVCRHDSPITVDTKEKEGKKYSISICDNCGNIYCSDVEEVKPIENKG